MIRTIGNIPKLDEVNTQRLNHLFELCKKFHYEHPPQKGGSTADQDYTFEKKAEMDDLMANLKSFNDYVETIFPNNKDDAVAFVLMLQALYNAVSLVAARFNNENILEMVTATMPVLNIEHEQIKEYIDDINEFIVAKESTDLWSVS